MYVPGSLESTTVESVNYPAHPPVNVIRRNKDLESPPKELEHATRHFTGNQENPSRTLNRTPKERRRPRERRVGQTR